MSVLDWIILGIICLSTLVSLKRGFVKEALSLTAWVAAFLIATAFSGRLSLQFTDLINNDAFRYVVAYVVLFAATLMLGSLVNTLLAQVIKVTGLSGADRALGTAFGFARGLVLVLVMVFVMKSVLHEDEQEFMRDSRLLPHIAMVEQWARETLSDVSSDGDFPWVGSVSTGS